MVFRTLVGLLVAGSFGLMAWCANSQLELSCRIETNAKDIAVIKGNRFTATDALQMSQDTNERILELQDKLTTKLDRLTELVYGMSQKLGATKNGN